MMEKPKGKVTLKMIAQQANTSIGTVDRALNNRPGISPETRQQVLDIANKLGYRPNKFASMLGRKKELRIGVAFPWTMQRFYGYVEAGVDAAAAELLDYGVQVDKIRYEWQHPDIAAAALEKLDLSLYDGLAINSAGGKVSTLIDRFIDGGLPVVTFNSDSPESKRLFFVGSNAREAGMMGGELMSLLLQGKGNVMVLGNFARTTPFVERFGGFCEFIQPNFPDIHLYPCSEYYGDLEQGIGSMLDSIHRLPDINGVFCVGYTSTVAAVEAVKRVNRRDIAIVGFDVTPETTEAMMEGWCRALIYQDPYQQGYKATKLLAKYLIEGWMPDRQRLHIENRIVLKSNIANYQDPSVYTHSIF